MKRTIVMADIEVLDRLRRLARQRGVSFDHVAREALEDKAREHRPRPTCLGVGASGQHDTSTVAGVGRTPTR